MNDDFEDKLGAAWRKMGEWNPPPLDQALRSRLMKLRPEPAIPAFDIVWRALREAREAALEITNLVKAVLVPAPAALLRGDSDISSAKVLECRLGEAVLKLTLSAGGKESGELRLGVALDGGGEGNFNVELIDADADDLLESRPLRQTTSMSLRDGGVYCLAVMRDAEEIGRIRFRLEKPSPGAPGDRPC